MPLSPYTPRWRELLNRVFVGKRQGGQDVSVLDDIFPMFAVADSSQGEFHYGRGETAWGQAMDVIAGGAGTFSQVWVQNLSPDSLVVVESVMVRLQAGVTSFFDLSTLRQVLPAAATVRKYDLRGPADFAPVASWASLANGAAVAPVAQRLSRMSVQVGGPNVELCQQDVVLPPLTALVISSVVANQGFDCSVAGYDRQAERDDR